MAHEYEGNMVNEFDCAEDRRSECDGLLSAARALVNKLRLIHDDVGYQRIWHIAAIHGENYNGPNYKDELEALETVITGT